MVIAKFELNRIKNIKRMSLIILFGPELTL